MPKVNRDADPTAGLDEVPERPRLSLDLPADEPATERPRVGRPPGSKTRSVSELPAFVVVRADEKGRIIPPTKPETREKLRAVLNDEQLRKDLSMGPAPAAAAALPPVPDEVVDGVYRMLSSVLMMVSERWYPQVPAADRERVLTFQEPELKALRPSSARIIAKYTGTLLARYGDEVALGTILMGVIGAKMTALRAQASDTSSRPGRTPETPVTH